MNSSQKKNGFQCVTQNVMELGNIWENKSKLHLYTESNHEMD